jgi:poly-gamma-glutamate synthesis protein (capsule biosynthesis protein)
LQKNPTDEIYIATNTEFEILKTIENYRKNNSDAYIALFFHWNFDLETLPFPSYRQFSRDLIETGANLIIGAHSHCVHGCEKYKDGYIVYGLGNFFLPNSIFANGRLRFPDFAKTQLAFEININNNFAKCHWIEYSDFNGKNSLKIIESSNFSESQLRKKYTPYELLNQTEYLKYFKINRRKRLLTPILKNYKHKRINSIKIYLLKQRVYVARGLAEIKIIKWQN